jgi:Tryptophan dimethylallyltransferase
VGTTRQPQETLPVIESRRGAQSWMSASSVDTYTETILGRSVAGGVAASSAAHREQPTKATPLAERSFSEVATTGIRELCEVLQFPDSYARTANVLIPILHGGWAKRFFGTTPPTISDITDDGSPFEYSVALGPGLREVRLLLEPQGQPTTPQTSWIEGWATLRSLQQLGLAHLSAAEAVRDIFQPRSHIARFGLWLATALRPGASPLIKVYFDPTTVGIEHSHTLIAEAMNRLGLTSGWAWLNRYFLERPDIQIDLFSLDLTRSDNARIKIYTTAATHDSAAVEALVAPLPNYVSGTAKKFCADLLDPLMVFDDRLPQVCWSLMQRTQKRPANATLYLPVRCYTTDDETALRRMQRVLPDPEAVALDRAVRRIARRDLTAGSGIIAWASTKLVTGAPNITAYLSVEGYTTRHPTRETNP